MTPLRFELSRSVVVHIDFIIKSFVVRSFIVTHSLERALNVHQIVAVGLEEVVELGEQPLQLDVGRDQLQRLLQHGLLVLAQHLFSGYNYYTELHAYNDTGYTGGSPVLVECKCWGRT